MILDEAHEPHDHRIAEHERHERGDDDRRKAWLPRCHSGGTPLGAQEGWHLLVRLVQARREHRWNREEECVTRRGFAAVTQDEAHRDRATGAAHARDKGESLREAVEDRVFEAQVLQILLLRTACICIREKHREEDQHRCRDVQITKRVVDLILEQEPENSDWNRSEDDKPPHAGIRIRMRNLTHERLRPLRDDVDNVLEKVDEDGELSSKLHDCRKCRPGILPRVQKFTNDAHVSAR